jgi:hypothetical protein
MLVCFLCTVCLINDFFIFMLYVAANDVKCIFYNECFIVVSSSMIFIISQHLNTLKFKKKH